jgi:hypothetical protein
VNENGGFEGWTIKKLKLFLGVEGNPTVLLPRHTVYLL